HVPEPLGRLELCDIVIGEPDGADLPFLFQLQKGAPVVLEQGAVLGGPVHLVQVDALDVEPVERRLDLAAKAQRIADWARRRRAWSGCRSRRAAPWSACPCREPGVSYMPSSATPFAGVCRLGQRHRSSPTA